MIIEALVVVQLVEWSISTPEVLGSNPVRPELKYCQLF